MNPQYLIVHSLTNNIIAQVDQPVMLNRYTLTDTDGQDLLVSTLGSDEQILVPQLGAGGYGVVVRAKDRLRIPRAIKFFSSSFLGPRRDTDAFQHEIELTNQQPFKHVIRIMDYGTRSDARGEEFCLYVMDFVDGLTLCEFFNELVSPHRDGILAQSKQKEQVYAMLFRFLDELLEAIRELHAADIIHMDIKPSNIIVATGPMKRLSPFPEDLFRFRPFLTDLGAGKTITKDRYGETRLVRTLYYFPNHLLDDLGFDEDNYTVRYDQLREHGRYIDLYCFARTVEEVIFDSWRRHEHGQHIYARDKEKIKEEFWKELLGPEFQVLEWIIDDIVNTRKYRLATDIKTALGKLYRKATADALASEVLLDRNPGFRIRVGKDLVHVAKPLNGIVDHRAFQRLKNINQLAFVHEIYPGGRHNRFSHSVLTFHLAKQYLLSLSRSSLFRYLFTQKDVDTILCAALLHDVGQYPFAHSIEDLRKAGDVFIIPKLMAIKHDQELLKDVIEIKNQRGLTINDVLGDLGVDAGDIQRLTTKERQTGLTPQQQIARDIVNGTVDVDRVSYLRYDSYMTGVPYGEGIDVGGLLESLTIKFDNFECGLAVDESGVSAAEMVLAAIYWMYRNVYWHHTNRGVMAVIKYVVERLLTNGIMTFNQYVEDTRWADDLKAAQYLSDKYDELNTKEGTQFNPLEFLLHGRRVGYHRVVSIGHVGDVQGTVYEKLVTESTPERMENLKEELCKVLGRTYKRTDPEVLLDIPLKPRLHKYYSGPNRPAEITEGETETGVRLWVQVKRHKLGLTQQWQKIENYSGLAKQISDEEDRQGRKVRVFLSENLLARLPEDSSYRKVLERKMLEALKNVVDGWGPVQTESPEKKT